MPTQAVAPDAALHSPPSPDAECDGPVTGHLLKNHLLVEATEPLFLIVLGSWNTLRTTEKQCTSAEKMCKQNFSKEF